MFYVLVANEWEIAFKEWAVAVDALTNGNQIMLVRKGGISEDSKHFTVIHDKFLLYPTYDTFHSLYPFVWLNPPCLVVYICNEPINIFPAA